VKTGGDENRSAGGISRRGMSVLPVEQRLRHRHQDEEKATNR